MTGATTIFTRNTLALIIGLLTAAPSAGCRDNHGIPVVYVPIARLRKEPPPPPTLDPYDYPDDYTHDLPNDPRTAVPLDYLLVGILPTSRAGAWLYADGSGQLNTVFRCSENGSWRDCGSYTTIEGRYAHYARGDTALILLPIFHADSVRVAVFLRNSDLEVPNRRNMIWSQAIGVVGLRTKPYASVWKGR